MLRMPAKYSGRCRQCRRVINKGDAIYWQKGYGANCLACGNTPLRARQKDFRTYNRFTATTQKPLPLLPSEIYALAPQLNHIHRHEVVATILQICSASCLLLFFAVGLWLNGANARFLFLIGSFLCASWAGFLKSDQANSEKMLDAIRKRLRATESLEAIGPLLSVLYKTRGEVQEYVQDTLRGLLTVHCADPALELTVEQRVALCRLLSSHATKAPTCISILTILSRIGDKEAISVVSTFAELQSNASLYRAAQDCLASIQARREREQAAQTLLRAAAPNPNGDTLLRAADTESF